MSELYEQIAIPAGTVASLSPSKRLPFLNHARSFLLPSTRPCGQPSCDVGDGGHVLRRKLVFSDTARHPADPDDPGTAAPRLAYRRSLHGFLGARGIYRLCDRLFFVRRGGPAGARILSCNGQIRGAPGGLCTLGRLDHYLERADADSVQARHDRERCGAIRPAGLRVRLPRFPQPALLSPRGAAVVVRRRGPRVHRASADPGDKRLCGGAGWRVPGVALSMTACRDRPARSPPSL